MAKLQTFKLTNKAEALKSLGTPIKLLKTLLHATLTIPRQGPFIPYKMNFFFLLDQMYCRKQHFFV